MLLLILCDLFSMHKKDIGPFRASVYAKEWGGLGLVAFETGVEACQQMWLYRGLGGGGRVRRKILGVKGGH